MDISATGYILLIPGLIICISPLFPVRLFKYIIHSYTLLMACFLGLITTVDFELFKHWGFRFDITPLKYLGKETIASSESSTILILIFCFVMLFLVIIIGYHYLTKSQYAKMQKDNWVIVPLFLIITTLLIIPIRGGIDIIPMNLGAVFFHKTNPFANQAAINIFWNFGDSITKKVENKGYPEDFHDTEETEITMVELYCDTTKSSKVIIENPNVILILLESFSAKVVTSLGCIEGVVPQLDILNKEGIFFTNMYSSGSRTDKGLISLLSGYPAQPQTSIVTYTNKTNNLPKLNHGFLNLGYHSSFIYGGNINYANINSYLNMSKYDTIISKDNFNPETNTSKWGVHDHIVLDSSINYLLKSPTPFFSTILTLSSHEPFDVPYKSKFFGDSDEDLYLNSVKYTDEELGKFISKLKSSSLWDSTLVIITADHGARHPDATEMYEKERYHIPMLWLGGALQINDTTITKYASQTDLAITLFNQLGIDGSNYSYSKDIFSESTKSFATYYFNNGFGYVDDSTNIVYDLNSNEIMTLNGDSSKLNIAKAYMQSIFTDFNSK